MVKKQIIKNFISSWLSKIVKLISAVYMIPVFINCMGRDAYGLIILLTTILSFAILTDIGIRAGVTRNMAKSLAIKDNDSFNRVLNTGLVIYVLIWFILAILLIFLAKYITMLFNIPEHYKMDCILLLRTYGVLSLMFSFIMPLFSAVSSASNRFDLINYRDTIIGTFSIVLLIIAVKYFNIGIIGWSIITVMTQLLTLIAVIRIAYRICPFIKVNFSYFDSTIIKELIQFGGITFIGGWSRKMKIDADPLLISSILGPAPISIYRAGVSIPSQSRTILSSFVGQITSVSTNLYAVGDEERFLKLFERGTRLTLFMGVPVLILLSVFSYDIMHLWLSKSFNEEELINSSRCLQGMVLVDFCFYLEGSSYAILYGMNRLKFMTLTDIFLGVFNIVCSYLILKYSGLGVWVVIVPTVILEAIARPFYLYYTANQISYPLKWVLTRIYLPTFWIFLPTFITAVVSYIYIPYSGFLKLFLEVFTTSIVYVVALWYVGFDAMDKTDIITVFNKDKKR